ncbi:N-acetyl-1-D-myo-inositol-2-amino-2-deoxy-alpha-D-glucopyranoside deacetylase [Actinokineospora bangkokensis]|uniref:1D-myo-inositol 2-acetamido-2-deoxy-alpha-D-glucopyranoside deacetylase n=1 Tax=Actinokineospora bangkokensis TaxID=1193682 RepID=A0A1Q9LDH8_9PSEU|nr:N-acetyl-1-D-myo-inositol-2-amino-2-deoxy-alpha-D-glucopyranoside deacetylase [Actinokineospora bangkokensis]OLR90091.1 N-acetyl-1-D-myo-inositol-2-amino-2-deoxy-alpha-D-glucopyranoside deacetylase [Actinokineospora bangkokensis]
MLTTPPRLLLVHAHPDDESLWTGGTIARYAAAGVQVTLVTCTLGEEGEVYPPSLAGLAAGAADQLGGYRVGELRAACAALGVSDHRYLGGIGRWRDSGMVGTAGAASAPEVLHPRAFVAGPLDEQVAQLTEVITEVRPQVVITYGPDGGYGHPDHVRAHDVTAAALAGLPEVARFYHVVSSAADTAAGVALLPGFTGLPWALPAPGDLAVVPDEVITHRVDVTDHLPAKLRALRAHATQVAVWDGEGGEQSFSLTNGIAQPVLTRECYTLARGTSGGGGDLFAGLSPVEHRGADR